MFNEYKYKTAWCPICRQGAVEVVKEEATGVMFLCCDECEAEWDDCRSASKNLKKHQNKIEENI